MSDREEYCEWEIDLPRGQFAVRFAEFLGCEPEDILDELGGEFWMHLRWGEKGVHENIREHRAELIAIPADKATPGDLLRLRATNEALSGVSNIRRNRNAQAHLTAMGVARIFERLGREITFGQLPNGTGPSTPFGRAVQKAFELLGIEANWRRPAEAARQKF